MSNNLTQSSSEVCTLKNICKKANDNIGLITFLTTILIGFLNVCIYSFECGKCAYWGVATINIDMSKGNFIYSLFFYAAIAVVIFLPNFLVYSAFTKGKNKRQQILDIASIIIGVASIYAVIVFVPIIVDSNVNVLKALMNWDILRTIVVCSLLLSIITLFFGFAFGIADKGMNKLEHKKKAVKETPNIKDPENAQQCKSSQEESSNVPSTTDEKKSGVKQFYNLGTVALITLVMYILMSFGVGYILESSKKNMDAFKVIEETQVVVYEGTDFFIVSSCEVSEDKTITRVNKEDQTRIEKNNVATTLMKFEEVD